MHKRAFSRVAPLRAKVFFYFCFVVGLYLVWRLYDVQVLRGPVYARDALNQRTRLITIAGHRGSILDRDGSELVRSLPSESIYVDPHDVTDVAETIARLDAVVGPLGAQTLALLHDPRAQFVYIARKVPHETAVRVAALNLPGVGIEQEVTGRRIDTVGRLASTIVGYVGTDENGLAGVEYSYDDVLRGVFGKVLVQEDDLGRPIPVAREDVVKPPKDGLSVELTLDSYLQFVAQEALAQQVRRFHATDATAIVMNPWTGEVLAMANVPDYDPNHWERFSTRDQRDRAVMDAYEPGSTYKLVTAAAALSSGKVTLQSRFPAHDKITVGGWTIHNAEDGFMPNQGGSETLEQIVEYSHNVGAAEVGMRIGAGTFYAMERRAGFGEPTGVGLAGENPGIVPPPAQWSAPSLATMSFGQGVAVTPLALTRYYCAIANGGELMRPLLVRAYVNGSGAVVRRFEPQVVRRIFSPEVAAELRTFLRQVVLHGTGDPTAQIPGYATAGKTGTAQIVENGTYEPGAYSASFMGMIPYDHPRYVIFVKIDRPEGSYYGSVVAAPVFVRIARAAMLRDGIAPAPSTLARP
ncbi:MAG: peptidoglycan D,D-transpeptidase FtsI family protein [Candidatus Tyrphobacter sp.]